MAIEIVDLPIENDDFHSYVSLPEGMKKGSKNKSSNGWLDQIHCSCVQVPQGKVDGPITEQKGPARHSCLLMWSTMSASCVGV